MMTQPVLITGVSSGLGHGFCQYYLNQGTQVYGLSRRVPEDLIKQEGFEHLAFDLSHFSRVSASLGSWLGRVEEWECVILNAGVLGRVADMQEVAVEELKAVMDVNLWANKVFLDALYQTGGRVKQVIGISSGASVSGSRGWNGYSLSKAAMNMLIKLYAEEHPESHFTALAPGLIQTAMMDYLCEKPSEGRFTTLERLQQAQRNGEIPSPAEAAARLVPRFPELLEHPSGSFLDIRNI